MGPDVRATLVRLCASRKTRRAEFTKAAPCRWQPRGLLHPSRPTETFTDDSAWEFIRKHLTAGIEIVEIQLDHPPGKTGYVIKPGGCPPIETIYVKLQIGNGLVLGRSFHESNPTPPRGGR